MPKLLPTGHPDTGGLQPRQLCGDPEARQCLATVVRTEFGSKNQQENGGEVAIDGPNGESQALIYAAAN